MPTYKKRKRVSYRYVTIRIVKCFFVFLSYKKFRRLAKLAKLKSGLFEHTYLLFLEGRLVNFLYRTGFMETLFQSFYYIRGGFIFINSKSSTYIINV
jgi:ribosomal protein S4